MLIEILQLENSLFVRALHTPSHFLSCPEGTAVFLGARRKPENPDETQRDTGRRSNTCQYSELKGKTYGIQRENRVEFKHKTKQIQMQP